MTLEELRRKKRELRLTSEMIAEASGVPLGTVQKLFGGTTKAPRKRTVEAVEKALYLEELRQNAGVSRAVLSAGQVGEGAVPYPSAGEGTRKYTISDYYALPEERRAELIDGTFYDMAAPDGIHQEILLILGSLFREYIRKNKGGCKVYVAPRDVQLDPNDDRTIVQPDVLVVCDRSKITDRCILGAPDLIVEILSPSTRETDLHIKASKYANAGVREYWIVDPQKKIILVYRFTESRFPACFSFADSITVGIWEDNMQIDFKQISEEIAD